MCFVLLSCLGLPPTTVSVCKSAHLSHLVPVFSDDRSGWPIAYSYLEVHTETEISHGSAVCPGQEILAPLFSDVEAGSGEAAVSEFANSHGLILAVGH